MIVIVVSLLVAFACVVLAWGLSVARAAQAKDNYVAYFANVTLGLLQHPEFDPFFKKFLNDISGEIENRNLADKLAVFDPSREETPSMNGELAQKLEMPDKKPSPDQLKFFAAIYYYLMALSYASPNHGGKLRRKLRRELADRHAMMREGAQVYVESHRKNGPFATAYIG